MRHERELRLAGLPAHCRHRRGRPRIAGRAGRRRGGHPSGAASDQGPARRQGPAPRQAEALYAQILDRAESVGVGCVEVEVIDRINILQATKLAMTDALRRMPQQPDHLVIDALSLRDVDLPQRPIIDGDAISASIAAASIVAKVTRDRICTELERATRRMGSHATRATERATSRRSSTRARASGTGARSRRSACCWPASSSAWTCCSTTRCRQRTISTPTMSSLRGADRRRAAARRRASEGWPPPASVIIARLPPECSWPRHGTGSGVVPKRRLPLADEPGLARARARWRSVAGETRPGLPGSRRDAGRRRGQAAQHLALAAG